MKVKIAAVVASVAALLVVPSLAVNAQQTSGGAKSETGVANSVQVSPVRTDMDLDPGASKTIEVSARNLTPRTVQMRATLNDFEASRDETGEPLVILDDKYAKAHSLKRLATISPQIITLGPNEKASVKVTITAPKSAMAGGYYGVARFLPADQVGGEDSGVALSATVGSLVLLKVNGEMEQKVTLESMGVSQKGKTGTFFKTPDNLKVIVRFNNQGNVQEQPFGKVKLTKGDKTLQDVEINNTDPRGNVLPDSIRRFEVDLNKVGKFGKYTVEGNFGYGTGELISSKTTFWVVPTTYIIGGIVGLLLLIGVIFLIVKVIVLSRGGRRPGPRRY